MSTILEIWREVGRRSAAGETVALATVVRVRGSTPRKPGARMVVTADRQLVGTVGGGCGEAVVGDAALEAIRTGRPRLVHVDLTEDVDSESGAICGGTMDVFVEPIGPRSALA